ncbi:alpha/beta-hydrolase [Anaeromyces robustus]|uniref:Alpha/beta-hydrolase n=1 Tax=Anaeromyces robustus TaxID=1754192 RepID=A0A1Y1XHN5_9FUNG|nr:alpha/beta-hydrolase [Anaeromyces robustus]|eukprot:ORX84894.1 alpha/beta-hydrolase [Anaeromyces robustus]
MKLFNLTYFILTFLFIFKVNAGFLIPNIIGYKDNLINLIYEKNVKTDIRFGGTVAGALDVYYDKNNTKNLKPVVIFVHGGAWMFGDKYEYSKIGSLLIKEKYVAVLPNYLLFPLGTIDDMVGDLHKAIKWTYDNIEKYGGNKNKIILTGHSAGAHLVALTTFKAALGIKNNGKTLAPLPKIEKLVLHSGPYDFDDYDYLTGYLLNTDVEHGVFESLISLLVRSQDIGPTDILKKYKDNSISDLGTPKIILYWADKDQLVPESSADNLIKQIRRVSPSTTINYVLNEGNGFDHFSVVLGASMDDHEMEQMFVELLRIKYFKFKYVHILNNKNNNNNNNNNNNK